MTYITALKWVLLYFTPAPIAPMEAESPTSEREVLRVLEPLCLVQVPAFILVLQIGAATRLGIRQPAVYQRYAEQIEDGHFVCELEFVEICEAHVHIHPCRLPAEGSRQVVYHFSLK